MIAIESLYHIAQDAGIDVRKDAVGIDEAFALQLPDGRMAINLDPTRIRSAADERVKLAVMIGHCMTGSFYNENEDPAAVRNIAKVRARIWAVKKLIPKDELDKARSEGCHTFDDLAAYFGVTNAFVAVAIEYYRNQNDCVRFGHIREGLNGKKND